jgi:hypothetical protein
MQTWDPFFNIKPGMHYPTSLGLELAKALPGPPRQG